MQSFDQEYSTRFANGYGKNVNTSGVRGVQRQSDIDDTGWLGKSTFVTLTMARIPQGLPNAGEPAMDAQAVALVNQAFDKFGGHEPPPVPAPAPTLRQLALEAAIRQIGTMESPANSNRVAFSEWYGLIGPWCAMFVTWCFEQVGDSPSFVRGSQYAYVPYIVADARLKRNGLQTVDDPIPGDLVCYDWGWDGLFDHVGIFEGWQSSNSFTAIEGNTSTSNDSNGGQVMRRTRQTSSQQTVFARVAEPA